LQISLSGNQKNTPIDLTTRIFRYHNCWAGLKTGDMLERLTGFGDAINDVKNAHYYKVLLFLKIVNYLTLE